MKRIVVVGGGPAGLMAAGQAAAHGGQTVLLEKMHRPARKLRISGKGRCNLTNNAPLEEFIAHFGPTGLFLRQAFHRFFAPDLVAFFAHLGVHTTVERGGRIFPVGNRAPEVADALVHWAEAQGVTLMTDAPVRRLLLKEGHIVGVKVAGRRRPFPAEAVIVATGGASYPRTGSTGDGYRLAEAVGHTIVPPRPALIPLVTAGSVAPRLQGLSLRNITVRLLIGGRKVAEMFGEMLFTHFGVSGPIILSLSRRAVDALRAGQETTLSIDLKPALDENALDRRLLRDLNSQGKRQYRTILKGLLPAKLIPLCIEETGIPAHKVAHQITAPERKRLRRWLKDFRLTVSGHRPLAEALVTAGGVATREINPRTMESRPVKGLYFAGEVLDIDADTGGYNLQAAFSTGRLAGLSAVETRGGS